jgi:hypothetical protein
MKDLYIDRSSKTPLISAKTQGKIELTGISVPEDSFELFSPLTNWMNEYEKNPAENTDVVIRLDYFNTSTAHVLLKVFRVVEALYKKGRKVRIQWFYEKDDPEMEESGEDYRALLSCPFEMVSIDH